MPAAPPEALTVLDRERDAEADWRSPAGPVLLVKGARARENLRQMTARARRSGTRLRPHFKTHQSATIGEWFREQGVDAITVSSPKMAAGFAAAGWRDITIAIPLNPNCAPLYDRLAADVRLHLLADSAAAVEALDARMTAPAGVWIEIDSGDHRTGLNPEDRGAVAATAERIRAGGKFTLEGLLTHAGHAYRLPPSDQAAPQEARERHAALFRETSDLMARTRTFLEEEGFGPLEISVGDTPTCAAVEDFAGVDEVRPGNFVFFDLMQTRLGSCRFDEIAVAVACPVISKAPERDELVVHGGAVHLSKERMPWEGRSIYGRIARTEADGWDGPVPGAYVQGLTQEHGVVRAPPDWIARRRIGDAVIVVPVHSCLTVDAMGADFCVLG